MGKELCTDDIATVQIKHGCVITTVKNAYKYNPVDAYYCFCFILKLDFAMIVCNAVIMFLISWSFTVVSLALASLIYKYVSIKGKAGDWGDGFKSAYFQLALRSLRSLGGMSYKIQSSTQVDDMVLNMVIGNY